MPIPSLSTYMMKQAEWSPSCTARGSLRCLGKFCWTLVRHLSDRQTCGQIIPSIFYHFKTTEQIKMGFLEKWGLLVTFFIPHKNIKTYELVSFIVFVWCMHRQTDTNFQNGLNSFYHLSFIFQLTKSTISKQHKTMSLFMSLNLFKLHYKYYIMPTQ